MQRARPSFAAQPDDATRSRARACPCYEPDGGLHEYACAYGLPSADFGTPSYRYEPSPADFGTPSYRYEPP